MSSYDKDDLDLSVFNNFNAGKKRRVLNWTRNVLACFGLIAILGVAYGVVYTQMFFKNGGTDYSKIIDAPFESEQEDEPSMGFLYPDTFINAQLPLLPTFKQERVYSATMALDNPMKRVIIYGATDSKTAISEVEASTQWLQNEAKYNCSTPASSFYSESKASDAVLVKLEACERKLNERETALAESASVSTYFYTFKLGESHTTFQVMWPGAIDGAGGKEVQKLMEGFKWLS